MERRKQDDLDWLAAQVAVAYADGGMVQSGAVYEALKAAHPDSTMTLDEVCQALVRLTRDGGVAVEFSEQTAASNSN